MKIMICGSMTFSKEMLIAKDKLEELGHTVMLPCDVHTHANDSGLIDDMDADYEHCIKTNVLKRSMDDVANSDAVLFLNYPKNGVNGYVGTSSMMEMGLAYYLGKRIFLLFPTPAPTDARWAHEVRVMQPTIINNDYSLIK